MTTLTERRRKKIYRYRQAVGIPTSLVPAAPYRDRLTRAVDLGWTMHSLESLVDVSDHTMLDLLAGQQKRIERRTAAAIASLPTTYAVPDGIPDTAFVPAAGAVRRVRALLALGWTRRDMQERVTDVSLAHLARDAYPRIIADKWRAVATLYDDLHMTPGPSALGRQRARQMGHIPPMGWDDIDDPSENPRSRYADLAYVDRAVVQRLLCGEKVPATRAERLEVSRRFDGSDRELDRRYGWNLARDWAATRTEEAS